MKHLKRFNESINEYDLKDFCETNLAYLMDDGLKVEPDFYFYSSKYRLVKLSWNGHTRKWNEIKDHIIPFLHRLRSEYELDEIYFDGNGKNIQNKFFRFSVCNWDKKGVNIKELNLSYDDLESFTDEQTITGIIFWVKI